jgi:hypothetical protein
MLKVISVLALSDNFSTLCALHEGGFLKAVAKVTRSASTVSRREMLRITLGLGAK